jgi:hypothetical protein
LLIELMLENREPIVLDSTNNVFVGPNEYFKIVIDDFDEASVKAWHLEDSRGNATSNLARGEDKHIDLLVNKDCRTVWHFANRVARDTIIEGEALILDLKAQVKELKAKLEEMKTQSGKN